mgnify:FL=1
MLLDVVLALGIIALLALLVAPRPRAGVGEVELKAEAAQVAASFRTARADAIRERSHADVTVDPDARAIAYRGQLAHRVRDGVAVDWATSNLCPVVEGTRSLRFLADGRSCGAVMTLSASGRSTRLRVDWLTGRVEISDQ